MEEVNETIPKIIHYCWFGRGNKPALFIKCLNSWKQYLPDYEFIEWNEDNFDIEINQFVSEAYKAKKFAFVTDYVRVYALYKHGGIYLDTDTEVCSSFDSFLMDEAFLGFEEKNFIATSTIGAKSGNPLIGKMLETYEDKSFINPDGSYNMITNVSILSSLLSQLGIRLNGQKQELPNIVTIYPQEVFSPYDYINCRNRTTNQTVTIHHFDQSWLPWHSKLKTSIKVLFAKILGGDNIALIRHYIQEGKK
ncbi:glycosyltransferase [Bacillus sp. JJ664]